MPKVLLLIFLFMPWSGEVPHEFYVSVTQVAWTRNEIKIVSRIFYEDLLIALQQNGQSWSWSAQNPLEDPRFSQYLVDHLAVECLGIQKRITFTNAYREGSGPTETVVVHGKCLAGCDRLGITNTLLMDLYEDQVNMIHVKLDGKKRSKNANIDDFYWELSR